MKWIKRLGAGLAVVFAGALAVRNPHGAAHLITGAGHVAVHLGQAFNTIVGALSS